MDKLAAYSDEEEELPNVRASNVNVEKKEDEPQIAANGGHLRNDTKTLKDREEAPEKEAIEARGEYVAGESREVSSVANSVKDPETNLLCALAPPPRIRRKQSTSTASGISTSSIAQTTNGDKEIDAEWGLGTEKQSGPVDEALLNKLAHFQTLKEEQGVHFNQSLNRNRSFRNPRIYNKLVEWVEVEETSSGYSDMIRGGKAKADEIWMSSQEARRELKLQGGKDAISFLQKRRQEESEERKKKARRDNIDFVGSKSSSPHMSSSTQAITSRSRSEALALAESRAQKIRDELVSRKNSENQDKDIHQRREGGRDKDRQHRHHH